MFNDRPSTGVEKLYCGDLWEDYVVVDFNETVHEGVALKLCGSA
jgi:hypothetical protein